MEQELTDKEIERLDFLTDRVGSFINEILPDGKKIPIDSDLTDDVICAIWNCIKDKGICTENDFYPFRDSVPKTGAKTKKFIVNMEVKSVVRKEVYAKNFDEAYSIANKYGPAKEELDNMEITDNMIVSAEDTETGELMNYIS